MTDLIVILPELNNASFFQTFLHIGFTVFQSD